MTTDKIVLGVGTSVLFDMAEADEAYRTGGLAAYRRHMLERRDEPLKAGPAFAFLKDFVAADDAHEIVLCSRNSPLTAVRAAHTLTAQDIIPTRMMFTNGKHLAPYLPLYNIDQFMSVNSADVLAAQQAGIPSVLLDHAEARRLSVVPKVNSTPPKKGRLRDAHAQAAPPPKLHYIFDFDGVLAGYSAEDFFQENQRDVKIYQRMEQALIDKPLETGPQFPFFKKLHNANGGPGTNLLSVVTARGLYAGLRSINTLAEWGLEPNGEMHCLAGLSKHDVLKALKEAYPIPAIFYDDGPKNIADARRAGIPAGRIIAPAHVK